MMSSSIKARGLADTLTGKGITAGYVDAEPFLSPGRVSVISGELTAGFRFWNENWLLITESNIFGMQKRRRLHSKNKGAQLQYFSEIKAGDYVVHSVHGIGRYIGVENVEVDGHHRDYLLLQYAGDDKLYVPVRLYAQRKIVPGHAFSPDTEWQKEFEEKFPYEETPDQLKAIAEIKADMEKPVPMDRLLCGDVGYGKTEVAIRAAFKAVMDSKQVALLVPTTVLAQQAYYGACPAALYDGARQNGAFWHQG